MKIPREGGKPLWQLRLVCRNQSARGGGTAPTGNKRARGALTPPGAGLGAARAGVGPARWGHGSCSPGLLELLSRFARFWEHPRAVLGPRAVPGGGDRPNLPPQNMGSRYSRVPSTSISEEPSSSWGSPTPTPEPKLMPCKELPWCKTLLQTPRPSSSAEPQPHGHEGAGTLACRSA